MTQIWLQFTLKMHIGVCKYRDATILSDKFQGTGATLYSMTETDWIEYFGSGTSPTADLVARQRGRQLWEVLAWIRQNKRVEAGFARHGTTQTEEDFLSDEGCCVLLGWLCLSRLLR